MKKILMISSTSKTGGGPNHIFNLVEMLKDDFEFYFAMPTIKQNQYINSNNYIRIQDRKISFIDLIRISFFIRTNSIDIVHSHGKGAGVIARLLKLFNKFINVHTFHGIHLMCHNVILRKFYIFYESLLGRIDSYKIYVSETEKNYAKRNIYFGKNYAVISNSVKDKQIKTEYKLKDKNFLKNNRLLGEKSFKIISVCRLVEQKNPFEILNIAKILPQFDFFILGNGPLFNKLDQFINNRKLHNVFLLGNINNVFDYLYASDIFLSTSLYEGLPISILEAMSIGLPIIASDVIGNSDTIKNSYEGYLYRKGNIQQAADYIKFLYENKEKMMDMITRSQARQRKLFSNVSLKLKYKELYDHLEK